MSSKTTNVLIPPEILRGDIECFILNQFNSAEGTAIHVFPSGIPGIVFHDDHGQPAIQNIAMMSGRRTSPPPLFLYGPDTESSVMNFQKGSYTVIQVILKPHALKTLFGLNAVALRHCTVELNEFSDENINERLMETYSQQERVDLLTGFLLDKLKWTKGRDTLVEESLRLIHKSAGTIAVKDLLEYLNISERQFERRFCQTVGISPLAYMRVRRFNEALRLMETGQYSTFTDIAYALNFHDQSHFIRDVKAFAGITPTSLSRKLEDLERNQAGYSHL